MFKTVTAAVLALFLIRCQSDACEDCKTKKKVTFYGTFCANGTTKIELGNKSVTGNASGCGSYSPTNGTVGVVYLEPEVEYTLTATADKSSSMHADLELASEKNGLQCHTILIDGEERNSVDANQGGCEAFSKSWTVVVTSCENLPGAGSGGQGGGGVGSAHWNMSMGGRGLGKSAGAIFYLQNALSAKSYTPESLTYRAPTPDIQVIRDGSNNLRQVKAIELLADIVVQSNTQFEVRFYPIENAGSFTDGIFHPTGVPNVVWRYESPDTAPIGERLRISEIRGTATTINEFRFSASTDTWSLVKAGSSEEQRSTTILQNGDEEITVTIRDVNSSVVLSKRKELYRHFPWGMEQVGVTEDPDGANLKTQFTYYEMPEDGFGHYSRLKATIRHDGSWEKRIYNDGYNAAGTLSRVLRPWKDGPANPSDATMANSDVTEYYYDAVNTLFAKELAREQRFIMGELVSERTYQKKLSVENGQPIVIRSQTGSGILEQASYRSHAASVVAGRPCYTVYADGRRDTYKHEAGECNAGDGRFDVGVGSFTREIVTKATQLKPNGVAYKTTRSIVIADSAGRIVAEEEQVFDGEDFNPLSKTIYSYDQDGKLIARTRDGRITYEATWIDGLKIKEVDEDGVSTEFTYDATGRTASQTRAGIVTTYMYDGLGRTVMMGRSGMGINVHSSFAYDLAGRLISQTSEDGLTEEVNYDVANRKITRTLASGATEITERLLDGQIKSVTGSGAIAKYCDYGVDFDDGSMKPLLWCRESYGSLNSARWSQTFTDGLGRETRTVAPSFEGVKESVVKRDAMGRIVAEKRTGEGTRMFEYDSTTGALWRMATDANGNDQIDLAGEDRIQEYSSSYVEADGGWQNVTRLYRYLTNGSSTPTLVGAWKEQLSGLAGALSKSIVTDRFGKDAVTVITVDRTDATRVEKSTAPDSTTDIRTSQNGRLISEINSMDAQASSYEYDGLGRLIRTTDAHGVATTNVYLPGKMRLSSVSRAGKTTSYEYYSNGQPGAGKIKSVTQPDQTSIRYDYNLQGEVKRVWGTGVHPLEFKYDEYGQRVEMRTFRAGFDWSNEFWPASSGPADVTTWQFQENSGVLLSKTDANGQSTTFTYAPNGMIAKRRWARGVVTQFEYNAFGEQIAVNYNDGTPNVRFMLGRSGELVRVTDAAGEHVYAHSNEGTSEVINGGGAFGASLTSELDTFGRRVAFTCSLGGVSERAEYRFSANGRLEKVTSGNYSCVYGWDGASSRWQTKTFKNGEATMFGQRRTLDAEGRIQSMSSTWSDGGNISNFTQFDSKNRLITATSGDGSFWTYSYNSRGEVVAGERKWENGVSVLGQQRSYQYDNFGNRIAATANGHAEVYESNQANQVVRRTVPGVLDVHGSASNSTDISINGESAQRQGRFFSKELSVDNTTSAVELDIMINASDANGISKRSMTRVVPKTPEEFTFDADGNLIRDGLWIYKWDAENRLIGLESGVQFPSGKKCRIAFAYDARGRRILMQEWRLLQNSWVLNSRVNCLYDGWKLVAEVGESGRFLRSYVWGLDSGIEDGDNGGIGGLLFERQNLAGPSGAGLALAVGTDSGGNVTNLVNLADGNMVAQYEYGPFGELLRQSGAAAEANPMRWNTKYYDTTTSLIYYGYRYYSPTTGRWISRDPIQEDGGENLYGYVGNNPISITDALGLKWSKPDRKNQERANVEAACGDTVADLAYKLGFEPKQFDRWLKPVGGATMPGSVTEFIKKKSTFSVPNRMIISFGDTSPAEWGAKKGQETRDVTVGTVLEMTSMGESFKSDGYEIVTLKRGGNYGRGGTDLMLINAALYNEHVAVWGHGGHGNAVPGAMGLLVNYWETPYRASGGDFRLHHYLSEVLFYVCQQGKLAPMWKKALVPYGKFRASWNDVNADSNWLIRESWWWALWTY